VKPAAFPYALTIMNPDQHQAATVVGATSKWQADGRTTTLAHGKVLDDSQLPVGIRRGVGDELQMTPFATKPSY
jgi:hypothetical protein